MELRDYQKKAEKEVYEAWESGAKNVLIQMPTGAGKTVFFSNILSNNRGASVAIAHRVELVSQISLTLARHKIRHRVIAQKHAIRSIIALHLQEIGHNYVNPQALCAVAGVDTLIKMNENEAWFKQVNLVVQDEGHHPLKDNKWGKAALMFPNARGLYPTATPLRADGRGLGRHADGLIDALIVGPPMRELINQGYLSDYRIIVAKSDLNLIDVPVTSSGDFSPKKLRAAIHKSCITGDVVEYYKRFACGKLGVTFAVDIQAATDLAEQYRLNGIPAEVISSKTPDLLRCKIMQRFRNREILQLVNVDLLGEGVDVPAIEVISMARPTQSYGLYSQQFGRALRPMLGKDKAIILDHVGNVIRHGLPDKYRTWSLDRKERRLKNNENLIPLKNCLNELCLAAYERIHKRCPMCGHWTPPIERDSIEQVDGDLIELDEKTLARMRGEIDRIDNAPKIPPYVSPIVQLAINNKHRLRQKNQNLLRESIAAWAGYARHFKYNDSQIYRLFYFKFGTDILTAQTLGSTAAIELTKQIETSILEGFEKWMQ